MSRRNFERILVEAVDEGLSSLGDSSKQAVYFHLDESFNIKRLEIPNRVEAFAAAIEKIFGLGANFLEILIMERLHQKTNQNIKWQTPDNLAFTEYVAKVEQAFLEKEKEESNVEEIVSCEEMIAEG